MLVTGALLGAAPLVVVGLVANAVIGQSIWTGIDLATDDVEKAQSAVLAEIGNRLVSDYLYGMDGQIGFEGALQILLRLQVQTPGDKFEVFEFYELETALGRSEVLGKALVDVLAAGRSLSEDFLSQFDPTAVAALTEFSDTLFSLKLPKLPAVSGDLVDFFSLLQRFETSTNINDELDRISSDLSRAFDSIQLDSRFTPFNLSTLVLPH